MEAPQPGNVGDGWAAAARGVGGAAARLRGARRVSTQVGARRAAQRARRSGAQRCAHGR
jgi:hypothetical protein